MTEPQYVLDNAWHRERERLAALENALDPWEIRQIEEVGITEGWHCLEVGAGGGSMARWLSKRVGLRGKVVATDNDTRFIEVLKEPNLESRTHNIAVDELEANFFDLVHTRAVIEHVSDRKTAIKNMARALKPGGWLVITSGDYLSFMPTVEADDELFARVWSKFIEMASMGGFDPNYGRRVRRDLLAAELEHIRCEGYVFEWGGDLPHSAIWTLIFEQQGGRAIEMGLLTTSDVDQWLAMVREPAFRAMSPTFITGCGRKPIS